MIGRKCKELIRFWLLAIYIIIFVILLLRTRLMGNIIMNYYNIPATYVERS